MAEINLWTKRELTDEELVQIAKATGFECVLDSDDFTLPEHCRERRDWVIYWLGINDECDDLGYAEQFNAEWAAATRKVIEGLRVDAIYRVE